MIDSITIGVSSCLLGEHVRYDSGHKHDSYITDTIGCYFRFLPVCPEVGCGLPNDPDPEGLRHLPQEKPYEERTDFQEYKRRTSAFFPLSPRF